MEETYVSPAAAGAVWICCDRREGNDWRGRIYTRYKEEFIPFFNAGEILGILDRFCDETGYPQASVKDRSFRNAERAAAQQRQKIQERQVAVVSMKEMEKRHGEKATFIVRIQYRQNATWQGEVTWAEQNETVRFRSALELLKLIDSTDKETGDDWKGGHE